MKSNLQSTPPLPLLHQSQELLALGYTVAAAVTARAAVEAYVLDKCESVDYQPVSKRGDRPYGRVGQLQRMGVLERSAAHQCRKVLTLGGFAAHGWHVEPGSVAEAIDGLAGILVKGGEL